MMKKSKGILSCALCVLLLISVFAAVPITGKRRDRRNLF